MMQKDILKEVMLDNRREVEIKQSLSFTHLANTVASTGTKISKNTIINYMEYSKNALLMYEILDKPENFNYFFLFSISRSTQGFSAIFVYGVKYIVFLLIGNKSLYRDKYIY